jgi:predicted enzyme related to lactoylglutathione lyase
MAEPRRYPEGVTSWIDVEQPDLEAAQAFYAGLFGWTFQDATPAGNATRYLVAQLDGRPVAGLSGFVDAFAADQGATPVAPTWNTYVAVDDADDVARRIGAAGGRVLHGPFGAGEDGRYAVCTDSSGVPFRLWQAGTRPGAQTVNAPGSWNFSDLYASDPAASAAFYADVFGWSFDEVGFGTMIRRPGYGDHLAATTDPDIHDRQASINVPPGFADAIGWLLSADSDQAPHWHVTFAVHDRDATAAAAESLGGTVLNRGDTEWTRDALLRDPQGALFTVSQFTPPT